MEDSIRDSEVLKQRLISSHDEFRRSLESVRYRPSVSFTRSETFDMKPSRPRVSLKDLSPIHCQSLMPDTIHYGHVLRGILVVDPTVINAAHTILEDEAGGAAKVCFYRFAPNHLHLTQRALIANSLFRNGRKVAIFEPFHKHAQDGTLVVRVENVAEDVKFLDQLGPSCFQGWRAEGKVHCKYQQLKEAIFCYRRSIGTHGQSEITTVLLSNVATCLMKKERYVASLLFAVASFVVDNSFLRPFYTAGFCLSRLKRKDLAFNCLELCRMLNASSELCGHLTQILVNTTTEHIPTSEWNAKVLCLVASENVYDLLQISSNDTVDIETFKEKGNELFRKQQYDEAIQEYCTALRGISEVASLLTNLSTCYAKKGNHAEAALHASAAILVSPNNAKAHYRKSFSLLQLDQKEEARASCSAALGVIHGNADLNALRDRIEWACMASANESNEQAEGPLSPGQERKTERKQLEEMRSHSIPTEAVAMINNLFQFMGLERALDHRVKPFHLEFSRQGGWPSECDTHLGMEVLTSAYEHARTADPLREIDLNSSHDIANLYKRVKSGQIEILEWWVNAPVDSLSPRKRNPYESNMHHSFTNSPCRTNVMHSGTVHVSVGFVDLSELLFSKLMPHAGRSGPLRWIGYEASAYSVAKSMVLAHMLGHQAETDCILQVWFSSSWSKKTLVSFRKALNELLHRVKGIDVSKTSAAVFRLLQHWQQFDVTLRTARSKWLRRHNLTNLVEIANFRRKMDRLAMCHYLVSGEVLDGEVGSIVMFGVPSTKDGDEHQIAMDEWFMHCLPIHKLVKGLDTKTTFIEAAINILRKHVSELKRLVSGDEVVIEIRHKIVKLSNECVTREIRKLSPRSISWSNICDYCSNKEFHKMTLACSGSDTTHYVSSMNWSTEVKGTFMMDYTVDDQQRFLKAGNDTIATWYQFTGLIDYLHAPPITHHYNIGEYYLCHKEKKIWTENFFEAAALKDSKKQTVIELIPFDVLARTSNIIEMVYTFNTAKQLKASDVYGE